MSLAHMSCPQGPGETIFVMIMSGLLHAFGLLAPLWRCGVALVAKVQGCRDTSKDKGAHLEASNTPKGHDIATAFSSSSTTPLCRYRPSTKNPEQGGTAAQVLGRINTILDRLFSVVPKATVRGIDDSCSSFFVNPRNGIRGISISALSVR